MSNHHLLADEVHKTFFDCEKYLLPPAARVEQPFETFWRAANDGYDPPDKTNRYALAEPEARQSTTSWCRPAGECAGSVSTTTCTTTSTSTAVRRSGNA
jgi:hypothetical protein